MARHLYYEFIDENGNTLAAFIYKMNAKTMAYKSKHSINQHCDYFYKKCRDILSKSSNGYKFKSLTRFKMCFVSYIELISIRLSNSFPIRLIAALDENEYYCRMDDKIYYCVKKEDTLHSIAKKYLHDENKSIMLSCLNNIKEECKLIPGEVIQIPVS